VGKNILDLLSRNARKPVEKIVNAGSAFNILK
jgi:hypothetical protein